MTVPTRTAGRRSASQGPGGRCAVDLDFNVKRIEEVTLDGPPELMARDLMSPYVWREADGRWA